MSQGASPVDPDAAAAAAADAVRRLGHALTGHLPEGELLARVEALASDLAAQIEQTPRRDKRQEMLERGRLGEFLRTGAWPGPVDDGASIEFDRFSIIGGRLSPFGMGAHYHRQGNEAHARITLGPAFEGPPTRAHGGVVAAVVDEVMATLLSVLGTVAYTGRLTVDYVRAAPLGVELNFRSWLDRQEGRRLQIGCEGSAEGVVFVRGEGVFIEQDPARLLEFG
ncbi:MAG: hypothetical protein QOJ19_276 [Acidimicrobiia bacterium]|jgi:acyl-coenzyme A thioesterase PaaI-like protein|nr:hypothetical protein [Acidimicrobiia bacterium]